MQPPSSSGTGGAVEAWAPTPEAMKRLGAALASVLGPGDTVLLGGDLGAGKTTFTQGLALALGTAGPVTSPTFVLVHSYRTRAGWDLLHADVWRLEQLQEVVDLAIPELQEEGAAAVVEWGERAAPALAPDCLHVAIDFSPVSGTDGDGSAGTGPDGPRRLVFTARGPSWRARLARLASALAAAA
jgi:tRNA threonylcarbamoyladenosine biosynthesis protein TsaE